MEIKRLSKYSLFEDYYFNGSVVILQVTQVFRNIYFSFFYKTTIHSLTVNYLTEYCTSLGTHPLCIEEEGELLNHCVYTIHMLFPQDFWGKETTL